MVMGIETFQQQSRPIYWAYNLSTIEQTHVLGDEHCNLSTTKQTGSYSSLGSPLGVGLHDSSDVLLTLWESVAFGCTVGIWDLLV